MAVRVTPPEPPYSNLIVHVVISVEHGGAERLVLELATMQQGAGRECRVVCLQRTGALEPLFAAQGITVEALAGRPRGVLAVAWGLALTLRRLKPRVVHAHNVSAQIAVALSRRLLHWDDSSTRLVYTEHGRLSDDRARILTARRWLGRDFDAVVGVSDDIRDQLRFLRIGRPDRILTITNGVNLDHFPVSGRPKRTSVYQLVAVGRLSRIKGQDLLIEAFEVLARGPVPVELTLVGDGPMRGELEQRVAALGLQGCVHFVGAQQDVRPFLRSADLFVLPSRSEGISVALLEAMASGLPVVATRVGGTPEVTGPGMGAVLVAPDQPDALAEGILAMMSDPDLAIREGHAARRRVEAAFSLERTASAYAERYEFVTPAGLSPSP